jgi:putative DNA primase/helicase
VTFSSMTLPDAASRTAELGYRIFPCIPRNKKPLTDHGLLEATNDSDQIERWWNRTPNANIGINCDGLIVIDVDLLEKKTKPNPWLDEERARSLCTAPNQKTWSGGRQFIFRQPGGKRYRNTESKISENVDTRGYGGYVVAPPSFVKDGNRSGYYEYTPGCELEVEPEYLPEPPAWLIDELDRVEANRGKAQPSNSVEPIGSNGDKIPEGKRDGTLASLAGTMRKRGMAQSAIEAALIVTNNERCDPPLPEADIKRIAASVARYEPSKVNGNAVESISAPKLINLGTVVPKSVSWLWPNRIALGKLSIFVGDPGLGKSQALIDVIARVTTGNGWPDNPSGFNQAGSAVLLSAEDDIEDTILPRLLAAGGDPNYVTVLQGIEFSIDDKSPKRQRCFNLERDLPALEQAIDALPDCRFVGIDPISSYTGETDSHKNAELRGLLAPVAELAARRNIAVGAVTHLNKSSGSRALHRVTGSLAFVAAARAAWLVAQDQAEPKRRLFLQIKNNLAADPGGLAFTIADGPCLAWEQGVVTTTADDALREDTQKEKTRDREKAWLQKQLANGPQTQECLRSYANETGFHWRTIQRAASDIGVEKFKSGFQGKWSWRLVAKDDHDHPSHEEEASFDESSF